MKLPHCEKRVRSCFQAAETFSPNSDLFKCHFEKQKAVRASSLNMLLERRRNFLSYHVGTEQKRIRDLSLGGEPRPG